MPIGFEIIETLYEESLQPIFGSRYRILEQLGEGGKEQTSEVYKTSEV